MGDFVSVPAFVQKNPKIIIMKVNLISIIDFAPKVRIEIMLDIKFDQDENTLKSI